jgi:hypothetical protein
MARPVAGAIARFANVTRDDVREFLEAAATDPPIRPTVLSMPLGKDERRDSGTRDGRTDGSDRLDCRP